MASCKQVSYNCKYCGKYFDNKSAYGSHVRTIHVGLSQEVRDLLRKQKLGVSNPNWVGDKVTYEALHGWIRRNLPKPDKCAKCGKITDALDAANVSGEYKRDPLDWEYLCRSCHMLTDGRMNNLKRTGQLPKGIDLTKPPTELCPKCGYLGYAGKHEYNRHRKNKNYVSVFRVIESIIYHPPKPHCSISEKYTLVAKHGFV